MIKLIYGAKGSGKTKRIIANANEDVKTNKACVVFITDTNSLTASVDNAIRYINIKDYNVNSIDSFYGFIDGLVAANSDNAKIYIDGLNRFLVKPDKMLKVMSELENSATSHGIDFVLTVSSEELPKELQKFI